MSPWVLFLNLNIYKYLNFQRRFDSASREKNFNGGSLPGKASKRRENTHIRDTVSK